MERLIEMFEITKEDLEKILREKVGGAEKNILQKHYGLNGENIHTLEQIAVELNISMEKAREIELKGINKIKSIINNK